jgi:hypothetical protein
MISLRRLSVFFFAACLLLSACSINPSFPTPTKADPGVVLTAAAETALARLNTNPTATEKPQPTATVGPTPTVLATIQPGPTTVVTAVTAAPTVQATSTTGGNQSAPPGDKAELVSDLEVPDGTVFQPGQNFVKIWRIKNTGTTTWTKEYSLARISGDAIVGPGSVNVPNQVAPGETVDIPVSLTAPTTTGTHTSYWKLKNAQGQYFGGSASLDTAIWVQIIVAGSGTPQPTSASGTPNAGIVSQVSLSVDNASYSGSCPHTFNLTANLTLSKNSDVTFKLEAGSDTEGYTFQLPASQTVSLTTGSHSMSFTLDMTDTGSGWVKLHVIAPDNIASNAVNFELTCK